MYFIKWILPMVCVSGALSAQALGDLNGLINSADKYVSQGMAGTPTRQTLELCKLTGDNGGQPDRLMLRSVDVAHWSFLYRIDTIADQAAGDSTVMPKLHRSATAECNQGIFGGFQYSPSKVTGLKPLEHAWIAISLGDAITQLNGLGYFRGFSKVTLMRPANPDLPDEYVYVFECPWERNQVAISTQTGALSWRATD